MSDGTYTTGTGQELKGVHQPERCAGQNCVIHNPSDHSMRDFPTHWRGDRRIMERICPHGIGHPDPDEIDPNTVHGCDGCCTPENVECPRCEGEGTVGSRSHDDPEQVVCPRCRGSRRENVEEPK